MKPIDSLSISFAGGADGITFAAAMLLDAALAPRLTVTARQGGRAGAGLRLRAEPFSGRLGLAVPSEPGGARDRVYLSDVRGWRAGDTLTITHATQPAVNEVVGVLSVDADQHLLVLVAPLVNDYAIDSSCSVTGRFNLHVSDPRRVQAEESFFNLSMAAGPRLCTTVVNGSSGSGLVALALAPGPGAAPVGEVTLAGGSDPDEVPITASTGYEADGSLFQPVVGGAPVGLAALEAVPAVSLVAMPDIVRRADLSDADRVSMQRQLLFHCQKAGERFALLDLPWGLTPAQALGWPEHFADPGLSPYCAAYYPWLSVAMEKAQRWVPPSGVVAGAFARVDRQKGVGHAPANVQLKGAVALERELDAAGQGALNSAGVNCIRKFEVGALRLWGARTLSRELEHLYVHHRRLLLLAIKGLRVGLRWAVFEPNDAGLSRRIKTSIEGFLRGLLAGAASAGVRVEDSFYVNVGDDLNDPATRDAGQLLAEVGIALSKPAEFIVISVKRTPDILTLVEAET